MISLNTYSQAAVFQIKLSIQPMRLLPYLCFLLFVFSLFSCTRYAIYQHPMGLNSNPYARIPLKSDSSKSALYVSGSLMLGFANQGSTDDLGSIQGNIQKGTNFGSFQAHYGINSSLGYYYPKKLGNLGTTNYNPMLNDTYIDSIGGTKFYGSLGVSGGINTVIPFEKGGEWRIFGLEFSHQYEWDNSYAAFRKKIPKTDANFVEHSRHFSTLGMTSEVLFKLSNTENLGYKTLVGFSLSNPRYYETFTMSSRPVRTFFTQYLQYTFNGGTIYFQASVGYYSQSGMMGFIYRLR